MIKQLCNYLGKKTFKDGFTREDVELYRKMKNIIEDEKRQQKYDDIELFVKLVQKPILA